MSAGKMKGNLVSLIVLCLISSLTAQGDAPTQEAVKALTDKLLNNYSRYRIPGDLSSTFNVTIVMDLLAVGEIDEIEEKVSTIMGVYYQWVDYFLKWNATEEGIPELILGWVDVWKPILRVGNPHTDDISQRVDHTYDTVVLLSDGRCFLDEMMTTRTTCDLDMTYFPFDTQSCEIEMHVVGHTQFSFNVDAYIYKSIDKADASHGSWSLIGYNVTSLGGSFGGQFTIEMKFERRPLFILLNILLPIIILAMLTPVVFVLPKKSGERVGYAITMLLAISVYMTIVSDHLPQNSQPMPLVSIMMFIWYIMDALIVFIVIINTKIHTTNENKPVPFILRKFVLLTRTLACKKNSKIGDEGPKEESENCIDTENLNGKETGENIEERHPGTSDKVTWQELSHSIDKWCFVISIMCKILVPVIFFSIVKSGGKEEESE